MTRDSGLFAVTLTADASTIAVSTTTLFVDWEGGLHGDKEIELRVASESRQHGRRWGWMREAHQVVVEQDELRGFLCGGGHALVADGLLARWWPDFFEKIPCRRHYADMPFIAIRRAPPGMGARFARGKLRQAVLFRDDDRCRLCGRSVDDALDVKLHVHHVVPHESGGMTVEQNLITLCEACHDGMEATDYERMDDLQNCIAVMTARKHYERHAQGVRYYRKQLRRRINERGGTLPSPVLQPAWESPLPPGGLRFAYEQLCHNAVVRFFKPRQWATIAGRGWALL